MFFDWLSCYQDFDYELPVISPDGYAYFDYLHDELGVIRQNRVKHVGSYSTSISVQVKGNRIVMEGNPSRFNRLENLFGFTNLDDCFAVYNSILAVLGLPFFTKCTFINFRQTIKANGAITLHPLVNGAVLTRLDLTSNMQVGFGCVSAYLRALSMMPFRRSRGHIYADGNTVDWTSILGNTTYIYPSVYNKAYEFTLHLLAKVKKVFGLDSTEYHYVFDLISYCAELGVTRHEQKIKSPYLILNKLQYYGLSDLKPLYELHNEFLNIDQTLKVNAMDLRTINRVLLEQGICTSTKAANTTALYAINWMHGDTFNDNLSSVKIHRARLRKIGIDILKPCNLLLFSPVIIKKVIEITRTECVPPPFYQFPQRPT